MEASELVYRSPRWIRVLLERRMAAPSSKGLPPDALSDALMSLLQGLGVSVGQDNDARQCPEWLQFAISAKGPVSTRYHFRAAIHPTDLVLTWTHHPASPARFSAAVGKDGRVVVPVDLSAVRPPAKCSLAVFSRDPTDYLGSLEVEVGPSP